MCWHRVIHSCWLNQRHFRDSSICRYTGGWRDWLTPRFGDVTFSIYMKNSQVTSRNTQGNLGVFCSEPRCWFTTASKLRLFIYSYMWIRFEMYKNWINSKIRYIEISLHILYCLIKLTVLVLSEHTFVFILNAAQVSPIIVK